MGSDISLACFFPGQDSTRWQPAGWAPPTVG